MVCFSGLNIVVKEQCTVLFILGLKSVFFKSVFTNPEVAKR